MLPPVVNAHVVKLKRLCPPIFSAKCQKIIFHVLASQEFKVMTHQTGIWTLKNLNEIISETSKKIY